MKRSINNAFEAFKKKVMSLYPKEFKLEVGKSGSLNGFATRRRIKPPKNQTFDPKWFLLSAKQKALEMFKPRTKVRLVLRARMERISSNADGESVIAIRNVPSKPKIIFKATKLDELWIEIMGQILENISAFRMSGSGWTFRSIVSLDIHAVKYKPLRGGMRIPLPKFLARKKALINMKHQREKKNKKDKQCFKFCVARCLNPVKIHPERITCQLEEQAEAFNFSGISFPTELHDIDRFERQNRGIAVNFLGYEDEGKKKIVFLLMVSNEEDRKVEVNLLLLEDRHFVLSNNLSRLLTCQMSNKNGKSFFVCVALILLQERKCWTSIMNIAKIIDFLKS